MRVAVLLLVALLPYLVSAQNEDAFESRSDVPDILLENDGSSSVRQTRQESRSSVKSTKSRAVKSSSRLETSNETTGEGKDGHEHDKRAFSAEANASFRRRISAVKNSGVKTSSIAYRGGCVSRPNQPKKSKMKCNPFSGCGLECIRDYEFPNGKTKLLVTCESNKWRVEETEWDIIPDCIPKCSPPCQNNGICIAPNKCNCSEMYHGIMCQYKKSPCYNPPSIPSNSLSKCNSQSCNIKCNTGHEFPDGSSIANLKCNAGVWVPTRPEWVSIPDCQAICNPPCQNGGNCLSFNVCNCPLDFRGPQCQYSSSACRPQKLNFNGRYNCTGNKLSLSCVLSCDSGGQFKEPPASLYVCEYATGEFVPSVIPQCVYETTVNVIDGTNLFLNGKPSIVWPSFKSNNMSVDFKQIIDGYGHTVIDMTPTTGTCYSWSGDHYKTFDGRIISFHSNCSYTLIHDAIDNTFSINVNPQIDYRAVHVFTQDKEYTLKKTDKGIPVLGLGSRQLAIPTQLPGVTVEFTAHFVELSLTMAGVTIKWDGENFIAIEVTESLWNRTVGVCGRMDGFAENDLQNPDGTINTHVVPFVNSWQVEQIGESCPTMPEEAHACNTPGASAQGYAEEANTFCNRMLTDSRFAVCRILVDVQPYYDACRWDYCACKETKHSFCACNSISVFVRECSRKGVTTINNWRDDDTCPMKCNGGRVYMSCGPSVQETCASLVNIIPREKRCEEGCYCPPGTVLYNQQCIERNQCPCQLRGRVFQPDETVPKDCNTCTCTGGQWVCTQINCASRCGSIGDPHYVTFDGRRFDFMGKCSYYLVKGSNYSIEAENVPCSGAISESMSYSSISESPSCTKSVTVRLGEQSIHLKQNREVLINGAEIHKLPSIVAGAYVHVVSSLFLLVELPNGLVVWWNGATQLYIDAPPTLHGQTKGLCGTFNMNQKDDFLTPEGDVEQSVVAFANKWKTQEKCEDEPEHSPSHPCDVNIHKKATAHNYCSKLQGSLFAGCHWMVDYEPYYQDCMFDLCSCEQKVGKCLCPILAAYAKECAHKDIFIDWRSSVQECGGIHCPGGQQYQICGNTCTHSCDSISYNPLCRRQCVEGCNCPEGQTLNAVEECIPISQCPCKYKGLDFSAGHKEVRPSSTGPQLCICVNADWTCHPATPEEEKLFPNSSAIQDKCSTVNNEEFTTCEPAEPVTCKNMHSPPEVSTAVCRGGCTCKKGYVLEAHTKRCIQPAECPCHHGGRSYSENDTMQEECNTCTCKSGKWVCTERVCTGVCTAWGDSHFKTFDDRIYDFHGSCDYVLVKGSLGSDNFDVTIQNAPCSSLGVSCSKSVTLKVSSGKNQESITFTKEKPLPSISSLERILVREAGLYVIAEVTDLGLVLQWDRGTRVYVKVNPKWKNKLRGLCGNFNDNMLDDFQTPSGGMTEVSATLFGDSWRLQSYCPESIEILDACSTHPNRKLWAMKKCGVLKSSLFQPCHSEVPLDPYFERCIFDTCACDMGGDCECLCTAIAAYAQECNTHGVPIKWRSQELCPIQCDEKCSNYSPCIQTCPVETCENHLIMKRLTQLCKEDTCVEGCELKSCPPNQVYYNLTSLECVPKALCKTVCLQVGDVTYYEGDLMESDECQSCFCSRHDKSCSGVPCTTTTMIPPEGDLTSCKKGWTSWINANVPPKDKVVTDEIEPLPSILTLNKLPENSASCDHTQMTNIECRVVGSHENVKETGLNAVCSIEQGLICHGADCPDFEIQVYCDCEGPSECNPDKPNKPHETNCQLFYQCQRTFTEIEWVEKPCAPNTLYNRDTQVCDWPESVISKWPECGRRVSTTAWPFTTPRMTTEEEISSLPSCSEGWSKWLNTSSKSGDYEILETYQEEGELPCDRGLVKDIECKFYQDTPSGPLLVDYTESGETVTCKPYQGLACNGRSQLDGSCEDYAIRVYCACGEVTSPVSSTQTTEIPTTTVEGGRTTERMCKPGEVWVDCGVSCNQVCLYYGYYLKNTGYCSDPDGCIPGCVSEKLAGGCPYGSLWREANSCVNIADCTCHSHKGHLVKPGDTYRESECETCQCINNQYVCIEICTTQRPVFTGTTPTAPPVRNLITTATPPLECHPDRYIPLIERQPPLPDLAFSASSTTDQEGHEPHSARLHVGKSIVSDGGWIPNRQGKDEYLQVDLGRIEPVYGVIVQGGPEILGHVTSYNVLNSDGHGFYYVMDDKKNPAVFRGPVDGRKSVKQMFHEPVEARYIRFNPLTWENAIVMHVEVIGCSEHELSTTVPVESSTVGRTTSPIPNVVTPIPECTDDMGLADNMMSDQQISVSSVRNGDVAKFGPSKVRLNAEYDEEYEQGGAWIPALNDNGQWVQFDFLEPRNLSGIVTRGQDKNDAWVKTFNVLYSHDGDIWNPVLDQDGRVKAFPANFDSGTVHENYFNRLLQAQYLRLVPTKWHKDIALRVEVIGCYHPYPTVTTPEPYITTQPPPGCQVCDSVPQELLEVDACHCVEPFWWDGQSCVNHTECPCYVGSTKYNVGARYNTEDCHSCICKLFGVPECEKKKCNECGEGLRGELTPLCGCTCKPCPEDTVLCRTSNICINQSSWCDGIENCPDDERDCPTSSTTAVWTTPAVTPTPCPPKPNCPPNTYAKSKETTKEPTSDEDSSEMDFGTKTVGHHALRPKKPQECVEWVCEPVTEAIPNCTKPDCPPHKQLMRVPAKGERCARYICVPSEATCNVTGRIFNTFDGTEYNYDICNHILAQDLSSNKWDISLHKNCSDKGPCSRHLVITQDEYLLKLFPDLHLEFDGTAYTPAEIRRIGGRNKAFVVSRTGDSIYFQSNRYGFWVIWDHQSNVKIGVPTKLSGHVNGLCGFFNWKSADDKMKPNGKVARTSEEFGDSWGDKDMPQCNDLGCPPDLRNIAHEMCSVVRMEPLSKCQSAINLDRFVSHCTETACACLLSNNSTDRCRCQTLLNLVTECQSTDTGIDLTGWRTQHDCPADCEHPFVHHDCYRRECEPSCDGLHSSERCDVLPGVCFSGCFCPDGLLRKGNKCIKPSECRDCVCDGFGDPQYMTFDRANYTFNGNCTYVASRDVNPTGNHSYEVLVTNKQCPDEPASTCTEALIVKYQDHIIIVKRDKNKLLTLLDNHTVKHFPHTESWLQLEMEQNKEVSIVIPPIQLQAIYFYYNYAFAIRLPSHTFANRTEGLCGNCNKNKTDDFKTHSGIVTNDTDDFGLSWLVPHVSTMKDCHVPPKENGCIPLPPTEDPCLKLIDLNVFKKCRNVLDPAPYIVACQFDLCHSLDQEKAACRDLEAYARDCERAGVCLDWRSEGLCPYNCPTGLQYKACQSGCRRTCNDLKSDLSSCGLSSTESCVCPDKQVLRGNKCVHESQCEPCDSEGHYDGDFWEVDNCTNCTCVDNTKECKTTDCSSVKTICQEGMYTIEETSTEDKCCKKVTCVQKPSSATPVTEGPCPTPPVPVCREDQEPVSTVRDDGCQQIVCQCLQCKPLRNEGGVELEVPEVELPEIGMVRVLDSSGCCPHYKWVCDRKKCPTPKKCKQPFVSIEQPVPSDKCCPIYTCEPPPNECMVQMANDSRIMSKKLNSVWKESPCTECKCVTNVVGVPEQRCTHMECPPMDEGVNLNVEYIVESLRPPDECCARNFLKACKVNEKVLKSGETSLSRYPDHCKEYRCLEQEDGSVKKDVMIEKCKVNCELGSKYISAESDSAKCCGECRPVGCVAGGKMYKEGTVWHSDDNCTTYFCVSLNGTLQIDAVTTKCLETPIEIHEDYLVEHQKLPGECCKKMHYVACIDDGVTYQPGEMWESITDPCKNLTCVQGSHGTLSKSESIQACTETCSEGWQYIPPPQRSPVCCGRCEQVACIHDGQLHEVDSTWKSENDCINFTCSKSEMGQYQVIRSEETCPVLNCRPDQVVRGGCCDKCNVPPGESQTKFGPCKPENVENTLHLVQKHMSQHDGLCKNTGVIEGFTTCNGSCISSTEYNARTNRQESNCQCCQATRFKLLTVALTCPDNYVFETQVPVPENCECSSCGSHIKNVKSQIAT